MHEACPPPHDPFVNLVPPQGIRLTPRHYAYLKIYEGCDHRCRFCIVPSLRGRLASRAAGDVLDEAERLVRAGVKELLVISQDTSACGADVKYATSEWRGRQALRDHIASCHSTVQQDERRAAFVAARDYERIAFTRW